MQIDYDYNLASIAWESWYPAETQEKNFSYAGVTLRLSELTRWGMEWEEGIRPLAGTNKLGTEFWLEKLSAGNCKNSGLQGIAKFCYFNFKT